MTDFCPKHVHMGTRDDKIWGEEEILKERLTKYRRWEVLVVAGAGLGSILSLFLHMISPDANLIVWLENWLVNFSTALAGAGVALYILKMSVERQQPIHDETPTQQPVLEHSTTTYFIEATEMPPPTLRENGLKEAFAQLRTTESPAARQPILDTLSREKALEGVALVDYDLERSNLRGARLSKVDMTKVKLRGANLQGADLRESILNHAQLIEADLSGADLSGARLERAFLSGAVLRLAKLHGTRIIASLWGVDLENADLRGADLQGCELFRTNLRGANLQGVLFAEARINQETTLPDGTAWTPRLDIRRFTDPSHPDFWRSDDPDSPAYRRAIEARETG